MRRLSKLLILFVLVLSLCGCHGSRESDSFIIPESFDESRHYEISFWAKNDTNINQVNVYKKAIADFEKLYPNITVNLKLYTDYSRIYNDVITNISTDTTPNICITYPDHIATYITGRNTVVPLEFLIKDEKYGMGGSELRFDGPEFSEMIPEFMNEGIIGGHDYAIPYMRSTEVTYINKDFVEKLGYEVPDILTWDFIFEVSEKAMARDSEDNFIVNGQKVMIPFIYKSTDNMMISMLKQLDAPYSDNEGSVLLFNEETRNILKQIAIHAESKAFSTFKISSYPANFLNAGQCIFAIDSTAGATWMGSKAPLVDIPEDRIVEFETVVRPIPQYDTSEPKMISQGPSLCIFNKKDSEEVLASWLFVQYLLTNEVQIAYGQSEGYIPVTYKALNSKEYQDYLSRSSEDDPLYYNIKIDATKLLIANTENTFVTAVFNGSASLRDAAGNLIESTCKAVRRKEVVDDAYIDRLYEQTVSLYHLDQIGLATDNKDLGPLPLGSKILLATISTAWIIIAYYYFRSIKKNNN